MGYLADRLSDRRNEHPRSRGPGPRVDLARIHLGGGPVRNGGSGKRERLTGEMNHSGRVVAYPEVTPMTP